MNVAAFRLSVYFGESLTVGPELACNAVIEVFARHHVTVATLFRGLEGYGASRRIKLSSFPDISTDLPLVATAIDTPQRIEGLLNEVDRVVSRGLVTVEHVQLVTGADVAHTDVPCGPGLTAKMSIYCGRGERVGTARAYRSIVDLLQRQGLPGATVLFGVDGLNRGARSRARLFGRNVDVPVMITAVGSAEVLTRVLPLLAELLAAPLITLERVALVKHEGEALEPFPVGSRGDRGGTGSWQSLEIYSRRNSTYEGRAIYAEMTRRLRRLGAAGVTTISGEWGFSSEETPHGDKLWTTDSYLPTCTRYIDHSQKMLEVWPVIDELTSEHGIVTSQFVSAYRERTPTAEDEQGTSLSRGSSLLLHETGSQAREEGEDESIDGLERSVAPLMTGEVQGSAEARWLGGFTDQVTRFARERGQRRIAVRVSLVDGEEFFLAQADPSPGGGFVTLYPHPRHHADGAQAVPARGLVIPLTSIRKIELLPKVPRGTRSLAVFGPPERDHGSDCSS